MLQALQPVRSSWLRYVGLESDGTLVIGFQSGRWFNYPTTQPFHYASLLMAYFPGDWLDRFYRLRVPYNPYAPGPWLPGLYHTGQDAGHLTLSASQCTDDSHYTLSGSPSKCPADSTVEMIAWPSNSQVSRWISHACDAEDLALGTFTYDTTFLVSGLDPTKLHLTARIQVDDQAEVFLNGVSQGVVNGFSGWSPITIEGNFLSGTNTLSYLVTNINPSNAGLRVEYTNLTIS